MTARTQRGERGPSAPVALGLRANWRQFALLVAINAFVGGMVGMERATLPLLAREEFGIASKTAAVSFIASFGLAKALTNLVAGNVSERFSRRGVLIAGWLIGLPVPFLLIWAPSWGWVIGANVLLGLSQGLAWSMTVNMKVDLAGPRRRGLALGINEAAGYLAVAAASFLSGVIAERYGLRPEPFYLGIGCTSAGLALSVLFVRDTAAHLATEAAAHQAPKTSVSLARSFGEVTWRRRDLFGVSQAGFVNNLNDGLAWGIFPIFFAAQGLSLDRIAVLAAAYPLAWGSAQLLTGWAADVAGRRRVVVTGMLMQGAAITAVAVSGAFEWWLLAAVALGLGTALVYPALLAAIGDGVHPEERATALGVYRFWRDAGLIAGALVAGALTDVLGARPAIQAVALLTLVSGAVAAMTMTGDGAGDLRRTEACRP